MTAQEMFENLGYKKTYDKSTIVDFEKGHKRIRFYKCFQSIQVNVDYILNVNDLDVTKEHNAIHQQMKELGWLDE